MAGIPRHGRGDGRRHGRRATSPPSGRPPRRPRGRRTTVGAGLSLGLACLLAAASTTTLGRGTRPVRAGGGGAAAQAVGADRPATRPAGGPTPPPGPGAGAPGAAATLHAQGTAGAQGPAASGALAPVAPVAPVPPGAVALGPVPAAQQVRLDVVLRPRAQAGLARFLQAVSDPLDPEYRHFLAPGQFAGRYGASPATVSAVRAALGAAGLAVGPTTPDGLAVPASGPAAAVTRALHVTLERFRLPDGRVGYADTTAPELATTISARVAGVSGLTDLVRALPLGADGSGPTVSSARTAGTTGGGGTTGASGPASASPLHAVTPCAAAAAVERSGANGWTQLAAAYGFTTAYGAGHLGTGETVAVFELARDVPADVAAFASCYGIASPSVTTVPVTGGATAATAGQSEVLLDVEDVLALAPRAHVLVYNAPNSTTSSLSLENEYTLMVSQDRASVISTSWGVCEPFQTPSVAVRENQIFERAAAQGQSVFAAAGDSGSEDCHPPISTSTPTAVRLYQTVKTRLEVDDPASQPYVTGVGGTSLTLATPAHPRETVWRTPGRSGGGGGVSTLWGKPAWQATGRATVPAPVTAPTGTCRTTPAAGSRTATCRQVPDVAASADPYHGDIVYCPGATAASTAHPYCTGNGGWVPIGGTSAAAPLWAALAALSGQSCGGPIGFVNPLLYQLGAAGSAALHDITSGSNTATGAHPGVYSAAPGYDDASGWGSPGGAAFLSAACATAVGTPGVALTDTVAGRSGVGYTVTFHTSATGALAAGEAISLDAPAGTVFPAAAADYTVNGQPAAAATAAGAGSVVTVTVPAPIAASGAVTLVVRTVTNALTPGTLSVVVRTLRDGAGAGAPFALSAPSAVSSVHARVTPPTAGAAAAYQVTFATSGTALGAGGTVTMTGPAGTRWPTSPASYRLATTGGTAAAPSAVAVTPSTNAVTLTTGTAVGPAVSVTALGTTNPTLAGSDVLTVHTSTDGVPVASPSYAIVAAAPSGATSALALAATATVGRTVTATVTVRDAYGNPVVGVTVALHPTGSMSVTPATAATGPTGTASFTLSDARPETVTVTATAGGTAVARAAIAVAEPPSGYDLVGADGGVFVFDAPGQVGGFFGSLPGIGVRPNKPVVGMVPTADDGGYFLVAADGGVFAFGDAPFLGSLPGIGVIPNQPITGLVATGTDRGYFLVGRDGGVFAFGTATFYGSLPGEGLAVNDIIGIAATPSGNGYWLVSATGQVYAFGAAGHFGTATGTPSPVTAIAGTPDGGGYWITTADGTVYAHGDARGFGTLPAIHVVPNLPVIGLVPTAGTGGYWLLGADGGIFSFGNAAFVGSLPGLGINVRNIVGAVRN